MPVVRVLSVVSAVSAVVAGSVASLAVALLSRRVSLAALSLVASLAVALLSRRVSLAALSLAVLSRLASLAVALLSRRVSLAALSLAVLSRLASLAVALLSRRVSLAALSLAGLVGGCLAVSAGLAGRLLADVALVGCGVGLLASGCAVGRRPGIAAGRPVRPVLAVGAADVAWPAGQAARRAVAVTRNVVAPEPVRGVRRPVRHQPAACRAPRRRSTTAPLCGPGPTSWTDRSCRTRRRGRCGRG